MGLKIRRKSGTKILLSCFQGSMWDLQVACIRVCGSDFKVFSLNYQKCRPTIVSDSQKMFAGLMFLVLGLRV